LIEAKRKGNDIQVAEDAPQATNVVDLLEALRRSVDSARGGRSAKKTTARKKTAKKKTAKKTAAKKTAAKTSQGSRKAS
jgi:DNA end-binding protein Ku